MEIRKEIAVLSTTIGVAHSYEHRLKPFLMGLKLNRINTYATNICHLLYRKQTKWNAQKRKKENFYGETNIKRNDAIKLREGERERKTNENGGKEKKMFQN